MTKILIVDDSKLGRKIVSVPLSEQGYEVVEAYDGVDALEKLHSQDFDLVLTDLLMPRMDGEQFLGRLRQEGYRTPVIIISADIQESTRQRCDELGMDRFLNKPVKADTLLEVIQTCLAAAEDTRRRGKGMNLTEQQLDALTEIINIGVGRAASSLSTLMGQRVELSIPRLVVESVDKLKPHADETKTPETSVVQEFSGRITGRALLAFPDLSSLKLAQVLSGMEHQPTELDVDLRGIVNEVGNIVLNGVLGSLSNLFGDHLKYSIPQLHLNQSAYQVLLETLDQDDLDEYLVLVADARFDIAESNIRGSLIVMFKIGDIGPMLDSFITQATISC